jgi:rhodanese-related sulfurtransferase
MVKRIDVDELIELVAGGAQLVDVLPTATFEQVHIPTARNLPLDSFDDSTARAIDLHRPVVVYCFDQH